MTASASSSVAKRGLLLLAHGARDPSWALPFEAVARQVRARDDSLMVSLAFLELMSPPIIEAGHALAAAGCTRVDLLPLFLGAGGHVRKDLPVFLRKLEAAHPSVTWRMQPAIGEIESVVQAMAQAALDLIDSAVIERSAGSPPSAPDAPPDASTNTKHP
jgi:sirohydrochlorin cobaltochelatase